MAGDFDLTDKDAEEMLRDKVEINVDFMAPNHALARLLVRDALNHVPVDRLPEHINIMRPSYQKADVAILVKTRHIVGLLNGYALTNFTFDLMRDPVIFGAELSNMMFEALKKQQESRVVRNP